MPAVECISARAVAAGPRVHGAARRGFVLTSAALVGLGTLPAIALAGESQVRSIRLCHLHTGEQLRLILRRGEAPTESMQRSFERLMRDHYSGAVGDIDERLLPFLFRLQQSLSLEHPKIDVISGFRTRRTNDALRRRSRDGGVARNSFHVLGQAIDIRMPGVALKELRDAALAERFGGVGMYSKSRFVHLDSGPVRGWQA